MFRPVVSDEGISIIGYRGWGSWRICTPVPSKKAFHTGGGGVGGQKVKFDRDKGKWRRDLKGKNY